MATYGEYKLNKQGKFVLNSVAAMILLFVVGGTTLIAQWKEFKQLTEAIFPFSLFLIPILFIPGIIGFEIIKRVRRYLVWIELGRQVAKERGYINL